VPHTLEVVAPLTIESHFKGSTSGATSYREPPSSNLSQNLLLTP
jgi:hypothetical protein